VDDVLQEQLHKARTRVRELELDTVRLRQRLDVKFSPYEAWWTGRQFSEPD
jgi:hypothetical protein